MSANNDGILELVNRNFKLRADLMNYPQFRKLWDRDTTEDKSEAYAYIAAIFFYNHPKSPYYAYPEDQRMYEIAANIFPEDMVPLVGILHEDAVFVAANNIYVEDLMLSPYRAVIDVAKQALRTLSKEMGDKAIPMQNKLDNIKKINQGIEELKKSEKLAEEDEINSRVKGSRVIKRREVA